MEVRSCCGQIGQILLGGPRDDAGFTHRLVLTARTITTTATITTTTITNERETPPPGAS